MRSSLVFSVKGEGLRSLVYEEKAKEKVQVVLSFTVSGNDDKLRIGLGIILLHHHHQEKLSSLLRINLSGEVYIYCLNTYLVRITMKKKKMMMMRL